MSFYDLDIELRIKDSCSLLAELNHHVDAEAHVSGLKYCDILGCCKDSGNSLIRGGNIVGEHSAMFISDEEILTISHSAQTRDVFAKGALTAAKFMAGKEKGYFTMSDVIAQYIGD